MQKAVSLPTILLAALSPLLAGCTDTGSPATTAAESGRPMAGAQTDTPSLDEQILAVQSGSSTIIESNSPCDDEAMIAISRLAKLEQLLLTAADKVTDQGVAHLENHAALERIRLSRAPLTDQACQSFAKIPQLKNLNVPHCKFSAAGIKQLVELRHLELLRLGSPQFDDRALQAAAELPSLRFLHLIDCPITDKGVAHLHACDQLESLYLDHCDVSDEALEALLTAQPKLHLHINQRHLDLDPNGKTHSHE